MDYPPPDAHHRIVFFRLGQAVTLEAVCASVSRLLERVRDWGMPYQLFAGYDVAFRVLAIDRDDTLSEVLRASAIDWLGERPVGSPTHRFGVFNRREDPEFADIYLCFQTEPDPLPPGAVPRDVPFFGEVRFGVGAATGPAELKKRFEDVITIFSPTHAFVETAYQKPRAVSEVTAPRVGWGTFVPERLGPPPTFAAPTEVVTLPGGKIVIATPSDLDDNNERAGIREHVAWDLLPFLEQRFSQAQAYIEPRPPEPKLAVPLFMQQGNERPAASAPPPSKPAPPSALPVIEPPPPVPPVPSPRIEVGNVPCLVLTPEPDPRRAPVRAAALVWSMGGAHYVTGIAKISFLLQPGRLGLTVAEPIVERDRYHRRSTLQSLEDHSDMIPYLARGEALVRGTAVVQKGHTSRARFLIQEAKEHGVLVDKLLDIRGDLDRSGPDPVAIPLRYEHSAYDKVSNPSGVRPGMLVPPKIRNPKSPDQPVGLGSISPYWPVRADRLKPHEHKAFHRNPFDLPTDFSWEAFSAAPPDQRIFGYFQGNERVYLDGFHAKHRVVDSVLPGILAVGRAYFRDGRSAPVPMVADTLRVDLDQWLLSLTLRGYVPAPSASPSDIVFVAALAGPGVPVPAWPEQVSFLDVPAPPANTGESAESTVVFVPGSELRAGLPFFKGDTPPDSKKGQ